MKHLSHASASLQDLAANSSDDETILSHMGLTICVYNN